MAYIFCLIKGNNPGAHLDSPLFNTIALTKSVLTENNVLVSLDYTHFLKVGYTAHFCRANQILYHSASDNWRYACVNKMIVGLS